MSEAAELPTVASPELPLVAIVGRPNVGKSTLFNRLTGRHAAIVQNQPGVTRDRRYGEADWNGRQFRVVDTGGLDPAGAAADAHAIQRGVLEQALKAVVEANLLVFVVDARAGVMAADLEAAEVLRRSGKPVLWVANKIDRAELEADASELYQLGADSVFAISAEHGRGMVELCDAIVAGLPGAPRETAAPEPPPIRLALVGRPNAGKSSLLNRLAAEERVLVHSEPGTTRDPVDTAVEIGGERYLVIDTAGIRRHSRISLDMDKIAVAMAEKAIGRANVCVLLIDAKEGVAEQDARIAGLCEEAGRALVIAFNKLDLIGEAERERRKQEIARQLQFVPWAKVVFVSARTGRGVEDLLAAVRAAHGAFTRRVRTGELNRWFEGIVERHPPSLYHGHPVKLYFIQQPQTRPPTFLFSVNHPEGIHFSYKRYLANQLRESFGLDGTPIRLIFRERTRTRRRRRSQP